MQLCCLNCGDPVSTPVPDDTIVRGFIECVPCLENRLVPADEPGRGTKPLTIKARKTKPDHTARMDVELTSREVGKLLFAMNVVFKERGLWADDVALISKLQDFHSTVNDDTIFESYYDSAVNEILRGQRRFIITLPNLRNGKQEYLLELRPGGKTYATAEPLNAKPFSRAEYAEDFVKTNKLEGVHVVPLGRKFLS